MIYDILLPGKVQQHDVALSNGVFGSPLEGIFSHATSIDVRNFESVAGDEFCAQINNYIMFHKCSVVSKSGNHGVKTIC